ncbi:MAG: OmpA family protein [Chitinophagales bacterium]
MNYFTGSIYYISLLTILLFLFSCKSSQNFKTGDQAFESKAYSVASTLYEQEFNSSENPETKAKKAFFTAESYRFNNNFNAAEKWYADAVRLNYDPIAKYNYGLMLKANQKYEQSIKQFREYAVMEPFNKKKAQQQIQACEAAIQWGKSRSNVSVENLEHINSKSSDFAPVLYKNGSLIFTSDRKAATGSDDYKWTGEKFMDIFIAEKMNGTFQAPERYQEKISYAYNDGSPSFNKNYTLMFFTRCGSDSKENDYCSLYTSRIDAMNQWTTPEQFPVFSDTVNVGQPYLDPQERFLIFSSDVEGGYGGKDLYIMKKTGFGWNEAENLGSEINTAGDEMFPFVAKDGTLYFASDGHIGMGGLDIFKAKQERNVWKAPENMRTPINSGADDFALILEQEAPKDKNDPIRFSGYFTSNRPGGLGKDDTYRFEARNENIFNLEGLVVEKVFEDPDDPNSPVVDFNLIDQALIKLRLKRNGLEFVDSARSSKLGKFEFPLDKNSNYNLLSIKDGYFTQTADVTTVGQEDPSKVYVTIKVRIVMEKIFEEKEIVIPNIYYDYDKTNLRDQSKVVLDTLISMLKVNPDIFVEIGSHTDSRGSDAYNEKLSLGRAQSVVKYLIVNGLNPDRLAAKGYGESKLVNECEDGVECSEAQHQENRRTTFKVVSEEYVIESIRPDEVESDR